MFSIEHLSTDNTPIKTFVTEFWTLSNQMSKHYNGKFAEDPALRAEFLAAIRN